MLKRGDLVFMDANAIAAAVVLFREQIEARGPLRLLVPLGLDERSGTNLRTLLDKGEPCKKK